MLRILLLFIVFLNLRLFAQENQCTYLVEGHVQIDSAKTIPPLNVILLESGKETVVSESGFFSFSAICSKSYRLQIKYLGNVLLEDSLNIKGDTILTYPINTKTLEFKAIEIKAPKVISGTYSRENLTKEQIDRSRGLPLGLMLEEINGVRVLKTGSSIAKPVIHGLHSNRILILNNGIRQEGQQWGAEHAPEIDPYASNAISLIKGANSIKYGFDAIGGIILVEPGKIADSTGSYGEISLAGFTNGKQGSASAVFNSRLKKHPAFSYSLQGSVKRGGNYHTPGYYLKNTGIKEYNFSTGLYWEKVNYGVRFYYSQFNTDLGIFSGSHIGNLSDLQNAFEQSEPTETSGFSYLIERPRQHIEHELTKASFYIKTANVGKLNLVYGRQYNLRYEYDKHRPLNDSLAGLNKPDLQLELTSHTLNLNWNHYAFKGFTGEVGVQSILQKNTYTGRMFIPNYNNKGIGFYWMEQKRFKKLLLEGAVRFDNRFLQSFFWKNGMIVSPKNNFSDWAMNLGVRYHIKKENSIAFNISKTWRPPSVNELYSDGLHHGAAAVEIGDPNLSQENSINANFEIDLHHKKFHTVINPYFNYFKNYIFLAPQLPPTLTIKGAFPTFVFKETPANIYGLDFHTNYQILNTLSYTVNISIVRGYNHSTSDYLIQMPSDNIRNKLTYNLTDIKAFTKNEISIGHSFVAKQNRIPPNSDFAPPPPAYHLFNLSVKTILKTRYTPVTLSVGVNNLLNKSYRDYLNRFRYYADETGRNFSVRIKVPINPKNQIK